MGCSMWGFLHFISSQKTRCESATVTQPTFIPPIMPALRFRGRHVQQTIASYVAQQMDTLGWVSAPINFAGTPMTFIESVPEETAANTAVAPNTLAITLGDEPDELEEQLGGGLYTVRYPLFIDIYGESYSGSRSIAIDVKDILTRKSIPVFDWSAVPTQVLGSWIEFENVRGPGTPQGSLNASGFRKFWRTVTGQALATFSDDEANP